MLGPLEVDAGNGPLPLGGPKQRAVLAHLLIRANHVVPAETLADEMWGDEPPETARKVIQTYVSNLRKVVGHDRIQGRAPGYRLAVDPSELDTARFDALVREGQKMLPSDPTAAVGSFEEALLLWRGPALADLADQPSLLAESARLDESRLGAQEDRVDALLASGADARVVGELESLLAQHPLREGLWGRLILALYRQGRQADALAAYQRAREILADELGIDPSPELSRLHERVLRQDPALDAPGEPLRGYRLLEKIGEGATGIVFRAIQPQIARDVAIKIFHEHLAADPSFVRSFEREAQAIAALEHPHIVPIYDYWREPGRAYVVSRYMRTGSVRSLVHRGERLEPERVSSLVEQIAAALGFAHRQGIAHGDVHLSNLFLDADENAYLGDFVIGVDPHRGPGQDIRDLISVARELLAGAMPLHLAEVAERADAGTDIPTADELVAATRRSRDPATVGSPVHVDDRNPYKGLRPFVEADAADFFGRRDLIRRLVSRLREPQPSARFLAVVGPSGGGKSSVVRAGLVPAVRRGALGDERDWYVAEMFPGPHPIEELEAALLRVSVGPLPQLPDGLESGSRGLLEAVDRALPSGAELLLLVDQFEEVFTLTTDESERELFLESIRVAAADPDSRIGVVITLRADFYDRPLVYPRFGELLAERNEAVPPLTPDELEKAIRGPAQGVGVSIEPGLVAEMVADAAHQPGALPLVQYALTELFERRSGDRLTLASYEEIGGVAGALSARAERIYASTDAAGRRAIEQVFLRLVMLGEGREDTRRRVARSELDALDVGQAPVDAVVNTFGRHRLLTFDREPATREPTVEIAHEALLGAWKRLRRWIDDGREDLRQNRRLDEAAAEWRGSGKDPSFLLRGTRLDQVEEWAGATGFAITMPDRAFLKRSVDQRDEERAAEEARLEHEAEVDRRSLRRLRSLVALGVAAALVATTLTVVAIGQRNGAQRQNQVATARELAAAALTNLEVDPERSILLAVQAVEVSRSSGEATPPEVEDALHQAVAASRIVRAVPGAGGELDWAPAGVVAVEAPAGSGVVEIQDPRTGDSIRSFPAHEGRITGVAFNQNGSMLATTGVDGSLKLSDPSNGDAIDEVLGVGEAGAPSFSGDGQLVAAAWAEEGVVRVLDTSTGVAREFEGLRGATGTSFSPEGARIAVSTEILKRDSESGEILVLDMRDGRPVFLRPSDDPVLDVSWSPDGDLIAAGAATTLEILDAATGDIRSRLPGHTDLITSIDWLPDPSRRTLVTGGLDGTARVWRIEATGGTEDMSLSSQVMTNVTEVAFSPDGTRVITGSGPPASGMRIWDVSSDGNAEWTNLPADPIAEELFQSESRVLATGGWIPHVRGSSVILWDIETASEPQAVRRFGTPGDYTNCCVVNIDTSADGATVAMDTWPVGISVRDVPTGDELFFVPWFLHPMDLSPDGRYLAVEKGGAIRILDRSGREVARLQDDDRLQIDAIRFAPGSRLLAVGTYRGADRRVQIWDREAGVVVTEISDPELSSGFELADSLTFDPSGRLIAAAVNRQVRIWDVESGRPVATLPDQPGAVHPVAFSPDGESIATGASDGSVRLFDVESGTQSLVLRTPGYQGVDVYGAGVDSIAFSPDGSLLASHTGKTIRVWALGVDELLTVARQNVTRSLTDEECRQYLHQASCSTALSTP